MADKNRILPSQEEIKRRAEAVGHQVTPLEDGTGFSVDEEWRKIPNSAVLDLVEFRERYDAGEYDELPEERPWWRWWL